MDTEHFIRIERLEGGCHRHFVVSRQEPGFSVEIIPEDAPTGRPAIRRVCVPNSWIGNYHRYARLVAAAQAFLEKCNGLAPARRITR